MNSNAHSLWQMLDSIFFSFFRFFNKWKFLAANVPSSLCRLFVVVDDHANQRLNAHVINHISRNVYFSPPETAFPTSGIQLDDYFLSCIKNQLIFPSIPRCLRSCLTFLLTKTHREKRRRSSTQNGSVSWEIHWIVNFLLRLETENSIFYLTDTKWEGVDVKSMLQVYFKFRNEQRSEKFFSS